MGIFKTVQLRWWQGSIFKVSMASFGILIGIYFNEFFSKLTLFLWIIFLITAAYLAYVWWKQ